LEEVSMAGQTDTSAEPRVRLTREHHVANKDDLLDGMGDVIFGEIGLPPTGGDWKTAMHGR
jgi:hypothetical protein